MYSTPAYICEAAGENIGLEADCLTSIVYFLSISLDGGVSIHSALPAVKWLKILITVLLKFCVLTSEIVSQ
jgi:hypothetical protein